MPRRAGDTALGTQCPQWVLAAPCCPPSAHTAPTQGTHPLPCTGTAAVDKVVFGVEKNSTFLECLAPSPQVTIRWLVRRGEETAPSEVRGQGSRDGEQGGLYPQGLTRELCLCPRSGTMDISWCWSKGC